MTRTIAFKNWSNHHRRIWEMVREEIHAVIYIDADKIPSIILSHDITFLSPEEAKSLLKVMRRIDRNNKLEIWSEEC